MRPRGDRRAPRDAGPGRASRARALRASGCARIRRDRAHAVRRAGRRRAHAAGRGPRDRRWPHVSRGPAHRCPAGGREDP
ncbi:MAG: hypothetical protein E6I51_03655 [Chloroflexi bacterium]|nr:MAG: hypothetical protein E6I51_03655 [Chloroflexota bacterium]